LDLLSKQVSPPTALIGFTGILDEKNFALNRAGGLLATDMPNAKVEKLAPTIPPDLFREIGEIDLMLRKPLALFLYCKAVAKQVFVLQDMPHNLLD
jgi:hypothetical protein